MLRDNTQSLINLLMLQDNTRSPLIGASSLTYIFVGSMPQHHAAQRGRIGIQDLFCELKSYHLDRIQSLQTTLSCGTTQDYQEASTLL